MTMQSYFIWREGQEEGPMEWPDLKRDYLAGQLEGAVLVRDAGSDDWQPIRETIGRRIVAETPPPIARPDPAARTQRVDHSDADGITVLLACGGFALFVGCVLAVVAFGFDTARGETHNLGLLNDRLCLCIGAATVLLTGCLLFCTGVIAGRLPRVGGRP